MKGESPSVSLHLSSVSVLLITEHRRVFHRGRTDVVTVTPWLAPVVWEGTFDALLLDTIYKPKNISVAVTVFAVGK